MNSFLSGIVLCFLLSTGPSFSEENKFENARRILESIEDIFIDVQQKVGPAVVTITIIQNTPSRSGLYGNNPHMDDLFRFFFGVPPPQANPQQPPKEYRKKGMGSGFILDKEGHILTNDHVVNGADEIEVTLPDGRIFAAKLLGRDPRSDLALIKITGENLPTVTLGDSDRVRPGQWTIALGNPFGNVVNNPKPTMTSGIISAIHRTINVQEEGRMYGDLIQTDASINQGNSGGPLVNLKGEVIGINTLIFSPSGGSVGLGFAIPINRGKSILEDLIQGKEVAHGWLGLWLQELDQDLKKQFGFDQNIPAGSLVFKVEKDSPAENAGLVSGDVLTEINGEKIHNSTDVTRIVSNKRPGEKITLKYIRLGKEKTVNITIGQRPSKNNDRLPSNEDNAEDQYQWRGMQLENITPEIQEKLKLEHSQGIIVTQVEFGSPAHRAKVSPGDIIYAIGQESILNLKEFVEKIKKVQDQDILLHTSRGYLVIFQSEEAEK